MEDQFKKEVETTISVAIAGGQNMAFEAATDLCAIVAAFSDDDIWKMACKACEDKIREFSQKQKSRRCI